MKTLIENEDVRCENCGYFNKENNTGGECRFAPPTGHREWPMARISDWCGRFHPNNTLQETVWNMIEAMKHSGEGSA
jgi:rubredoxin